MDRLSVQNRECMKSLADCHALCLSSAMTQGLEASGRRQHVRLMMDCAAACAFAGDLLAHKSQFHTQVCALCGDICEVCALSCDDMPDMADCAAQCRKTAALCRLAARLDHAEILAIGARFPPGP